MGLTQVESYLLDIGTEDYCRLWEATIAHRAQDASNSTDEAIRMAKQTIRGLLRRGFIELYFDNLEDSTGTTRIARKLKDDEITKALSSKSSWIRSTLGPDRGFAFATTEAGEQAVYAG